jgi:hypothetical protein
LRRLLTERYRERLAGVLSCYDRIIVTGTLPGACYAKGMTAFLSARRFATRRPPKLLPVAPHDCGRGREANSDAAALVDIGAFSSNAPDGILGGQYRRHAPPP